MSVGRKTVVKIPAPQSSMDIHDWKGRYGLLALDCLVGFGCYFNVDIPSALQAELQDNINCTIALNNATCCKECLDLGPDRYNQLYAIYFWMFAVMAMPGGILIDRIGNRVSVVISTLIAFLGTALFGLGTSPWMRHTSFMFPLMLTGRLLLGVGTSAVRIVQDRFIAYWFSDKVDMAFGLIVSSLRIGNVLNFLLIADIAEHFTVSIATWTGVCVCGAGFVSSICLFILDYKGTKCISATEDITKSKKKTLNLGSLRRFPGTYWLIVLMIVTFYAAFLPFVSNGSKFIQDKYGYNRNTASYINGINYDVTVVFSPILGCILNKTGGRPVLATLGALVLLLLFPTISYTQIPAIFFPIIVGIVYTSMALSFWPSIFQLVELEYNGTANGTALSLYGLSTGLANLAVGKILEYLQRKYNNDKMKGWNTVLLLLMSLSSVCFIVGIIFIIAQRRRNKKTSKSHLSTQAASIQVQDDERRTLLDDSTKHESQPYT